jgi:hypothetical protein
MQWGLRWWFWKKKKRNSSWNFLPGLACCQLPKKFSLEFLVLLEAVPAVNRPSLGWLERHFACLPALGANRLVHLARPAVISAASAVAAPAAVASAASAAPAPAAVTSPVVVFETHSIYLLYTQMRAPSGVRILLVFASQR